MQRRKPPQRCRMHGVGVWGWIAWSWNGSFSGLESGH